MMILGGSLGNLFDRVCYRAVPDFIDLNYAGYHWFIFNVADIFITIGIICLILSEFIFYKKKDEKIYTKFNIINRFSDIINFLWRS